MILFSSLFTEEVLPCANLLSCSGVGQKYIPYIRSVLRKKMSNKQKQKAVKSWISQHLLIALTLGLLFSKKNPVKSVVQPHVTPSRLSEAKPCIIAHCGAYWAYMDLLPYLSKIMFWAGSCRKSESWRGKMNLWCHVSVLFLLFFLFHMCIWWLPFIIQMCVWTTLYNWWLLTDKERIFHCPMLHNTVKTIFYFFLWKK